MSSYLPYVSTRSRGNVEGLKGNVVDKSQMVVGEPWRRGVEGKQALQWGNWS